MQLEQLRLILLILGLTLISGVGDAQGFVHASKIWQKGQLFWPELGKSALGFAAGIFMYWLALKYMNEMGINLPEIQTIIWFGVTLIGVAVISGTFIQWQWTEQTVAIGVLVGIGWLIFRTGG